MRKRKTSLIFSLIGMLILSTTAVLAYVPTGDASATGTLKRDSQIFARVGKSKTRLGKVYVKKAIVTDKFGREREVEWKYVGGKGTSRPTIKFTGEDKPKKGEHVSLELETQASGSHGILDLHLY